MKTYYKQVLSILEKLHKDYPIYHIGRHISSATSEYGDIWGLSDKELVAALQKYSSLLEMESGIVEDESIEKIIQDGEHLFDSEDYLNEDDE